jgi:hypothetical protein
MLATGAAVWMGYALMQLAVVGPVLDETVVPAQILTGAVRYPPGHPLAVFVETVFSAGYWLAGLGWSLVPSVTLLSASRNVLFLFLSAFVPFALTLFLTRRPAWGHVAAVLTLSETACRFVGVYLLWVFPSYNSSGHIGVHAGVLVAVLLVAGCWRSGGVLLGLMPAIHGGIALVVWPWSTLYLLVATRQREEAWRPLLAGIVVGLAGCAALGVAIGLHGTPARPEPPYDATGDGTAALRTFLETTDPHRQPVRLLTPAHLVSPIAFAALGLLILRGMPANGDRRRAAALVLLGALAWGVVFATRAAQALGWTLPVPLLSIMPGRYANLAVLYLLPLTVTGLVHAGNRLPIAARPGAAACMLGSLALEAVLLLIDRRLAFAHLIYVLWGLWLATEWAASERRARGAVLVATLGLGASMLVLLATTGDRGLWAFAAGLLAGGLAYRAVPHLVDTTGRLARAADVVLAASCVMVAAVALRPPYVASKWDMEGERTSPYEHRLAAWLTQHARADEPILPPLWPPTYLQPKTGHPILLDAVALTYMTYKPSLAATVTTMLRDLFGHDYANPSTIERLRGPDGAVRPSTLAWFEPWRARECREWIAVGARYELRLVLSPTRIPLDLPPVLPDIAWTLYAIPEDPIACPAPRRS